MLSFLQYLAGLKNCSFAVTRPTKLWWGRLKIFDGTTKRIFFFFFFFFFEFSVHFLRQLIILTLSFTFHMYVYILLNKYIISLNIKLKEQTCSFKFQVSKHFFCLSSLTFWNVIFVRNLKTKRFMNTF